MSKRKKHDWVRVPREPTDIMMNAGVDAAGDAPAPKWEGAGRPGYCQIRAAWMAMIATACGEDEGR